MQYAVRAVHKSEFVTLAFEASDATEARQRAEAQGLSVISVQGQQWAALRLGSGNSFPLVQFSQGLLTLLEAGLSLVESIEALAERESRPEAKRVMDLILARLYEGQTLSAALDAQGPVFPALYIATIRANERTGGLAEALGRYLTYRNQIDVMKKRVISASIYPALILGVGLLVILFLLLYVVPRFSQAFEDLGDKIPWMSRLLLDWGRFVHDHGGLILLGAVLGPALLAFVLTRPVVRAFLGRQVQRLPRMGEYVRIYQLARFYRTLGMLLRGGIPIVQSLDMTTGLLPPSLHQSLITARQDVREGQSISAAFNARGLSTAVALRMLRVGERTGQMGEMMERIAGFFDDEVGQAIEWFIRLFEPLLMVVLGGIIGAIVLLMYTPIFELAGSIQ